MLDFSAFSFLLKQSTPEAATIISSRVIFDGASSILGQWGANKVFSLVWGGVILYGMKSKNGCVWQTGQPVLVTVHLVYLARLPKASLSLPRSVPPGS